MWWRTKVDPEVEAALSRVRIFASLPRRDLGKLSAMCLLQQYAAGDVILEEGSTGLGMFLVTSGSVEVFKTLGQRKIRLAVLGQGAVLGEMALLDDQPRSASALALEPTDCLLLSRDRFRTLLRRRPRIAWPIVPALAARVRDLQTQVLAVESEQPGEPYGHGDGAPAEAADDDAPLPAADDDGVDESSAANVDRSDSEPDLLRTPYALLMTGAVGCGESVRMAEVFLRSFDEESGLSNGRPMAEVVRRLPASFVAGGHSSWEVGRRVPSKMLDSFRDHLQADRRGKG